MKNQTVLLRNLLVLGFICLIFGFCIAASSPEYVFLGVTFCGISVFLMVLTFIPISIIHALKEKQIEDRIKRLEEEVEISKKM